MKLFQVISLVAAFAMAGCVNMEQVKADAIQKAKDHCASHGKQFILEKAENKPGTSFAGDAVVVSGQCVGPGDPGYVEPAH